MLCLGIESTAHTFGCAVVDRNGKVLSDARDAYKAPEGKGIHPREASRHHIEVSSQVLRQALEDASATMKDVDIIGYSAGPGLGPCLRVGAVVARTLAGFYKKPLVPVNHALGHIELGAMLTGAHDPLVLLVSGGHTMILAFSHGRWRVFGETLDITIGQLLDQFGRAMGFASPCGGKVEQLAGESQQKNYTQLPYVVKGNDVSFSGLLTAAVRLAQKDKADLSDVCYSLQETSFAMLAEAVERALSFTGKREMMIVGGVSANRRLASMLESACARQDSRFFACPIKFAGDNGAQIAWTALLDYAATKNKVAVKDASVTQSWRLDTVNVAWRN
ncbi:metallohydrolase, glycoprotease/Kae1 family [Candidatus Nitrososphaera evergladensis SR1]|jgi:N6-L-threonylcarbamoyladenine synthase|uniref:tRNA N6-adenosine threonylcarbamoyltransferase n=1 Tax=Candidatus Nitrososphaera evergladensis SR1 TaxID=1459636 RepID=A0A075MUD1_9ARCH|nr:KEOPS complex N(6)-L-threonylcarbamoyladenine synthase Kae1 [Candidatus Nitrososphaera evergladensis]AIF84800.1 metallohydrolase, glycoprotease/Kae1 family [Candidatus Nitrososphaera evergladensis SR1]